MNHWPLHYHFITTRTCTCAWTLKHTLTKWCRPLFECVANRLRLHDFSRNARLIIARVCCPHNIYSIYYIMLHCVLVIARQQKLMIRNVWTLANKKRPMVHAIDDVMTFVLNRQCDPCLSFFLMVKSDILAIPGQYTRLWALFSRGYTHVFGTPPALDAQGEHAHVYIYTSSSVGGPNCITQL